MKESEQFRRGIALFNARKFFEAHEAWEELWLVEPEPEKTFLQGLIQLAAAFHHHGRGNSRGTQSLLAAGLAKLRRFPDGSPRAGARGSPNRRRAVGRESARRQGRACDETAPNPAGRANQPKEETRRMKELAAAIASLPRSSRTRLARWRGNKNVPMPSCSNRR